MFWKITMFTKLINLHGLGTLLWFLVSKHGTIALLVLNHTVQGTLSTLSAIIYNFSEVSSGLHLENQHIYDCAL